MNYWNDDNFLLCFSELVYGTVALILDKQFHEYHHVRLQEPNGHFVEIPASPQAVLLIVR